MLSTHTVTQLPMTHVADFGPVPVGRSGAGPMLPLLFLCPPSRVITILGCCHREMPLLGCGPVVSGVTVVVNADSSGLSPLPGHIMNNWFSRHPSL